MVPLSRDFLIIPIRQRILYYSSHRGFLYYSNPTEDSLLFLSQRISLLFQSDRILHYSSHRGFIYYSNPTKIFTIVLSLEGFLYYSSPTLKRLLYYSSTVPHSKDCCIIPLTEDSLLFQSDRKLFTIPLSEDFFAIPVRERILHYSSLKGFLYYSSVKGFVL